jgi:F-type H+-transporting ATPase subunit epsilon
MAQTMQFDLVSPERRLASLEVTAVQIPGAEGDLTAMPGHMPLITTLRPGVLKVSGSDGDREFVVTGGFAEVGEGLTVLAENAVLRSEMTQGDFDAMMAEAENTYGQAKENFVSEPGPVDEAAKMLSDMVALGDEIGLSAVK